MMSVALRQHLLIWLWKKKFNFKHDEPDPVEKSFMNNFFIFNNDQIVWEGIRMKIEVLCNFRLDPVSVLRTLVAVSPSSSVRVRAGAGSGSVEPAGTLTLSLSTQQTKPNPAMAACLYVCKQRRNVWIDHLESARDHMIKNCQTVQ